MREAKKVIIDAEGKSFGRLASTVAHHLRGKHLAAFAPNVNPRITVEVIHLSQVRFTGKKLTQKRVKRFTGYPGGLKYTALRDRWAKSPRDVFRESVRRMLPANRLRAQLLKNLVVKV